MSLITSSYLRKGANYAARHFDNALQKASDIVKGILGSSSSQPMRTVVPQGNFIGIGLTQKPLKYDVFVHGDKVIYGGTGKKVCRLGETQQ